MIDTHNISNISATLKNKVVDISANLSNVTVKGNTAEYDDTLIKADILNLQNNKQDKGNYALKTEIPTKVSLLTNDSAFINDVSNKQDLLISGTNIKTVNNQSILGSGNITIESTQGTSNYNDLTNKPSVNNITLSGNITTDDLGIALKNHNHDDIYLKEETAFNSSVAKNIQDSDIIYWNSKANILDLPTDFYSKDEADEKFLVVGDYAEKGDYYTKAESDGKYLTDESDPVFMKSVAYSITQDNINEWNSKQDSISDLDDIRSKANSAVLSIPTNISAFNNDSGYITNSHHDSTKQDTLVSGTNIKTINGNSIVGSGNIEIGNGDTEILFEISDIDLSSNNQSLPESLGAHLVDSSFTVEYTFKYSYYSQYSIIIGWVGDSPYTGFVFQYSRATNTAHIQMAGERVGNTINMDSDAHTLKIIKEKGSHSFYYDGVYWGSGTMKSDQSHSNCKFGYCYVENLKIYKDKEIDYNDLVNKPDLDLKEDVLLTATALPSGSLVDGTKYTISTALSSLDITNKIPSTNTKGILIYFSTVSGGGTITYTANTNWIGSDKPVLEGGKSYVLLIIDNVCGLIEYNKQSI